MDKQAKIYLAGHRGLVGSAIMRQLVRKGYTNIITRTHAELDLTNQQSVADFFAEEKPVYVLLAAAKVGGILANNTYPAEFIHENLSIQNNVIHQSYLNDVKRLLFLGSSCIYPKNCVQPIKEEYLLTSELEPTNRPYALAKIAGIEMCWSYNRQYGTKFLAAMPTNCYGPEDNYDLNTSHVLPALIRKAYEAKQKGYEEIVLWGTGSARREFIYSDDLSEACIHLLELEDEPLNKLCGDDLNPPLINIGTGKDCTILELAKKINSIVGFQGRITLDPTKPDGTPRKVMSIEKIKTLGWQPKVSLDVGLSRAYESFRSNLGQNEV